jgi:hypothetical protein
MPSIDQNTMLYTLIVNPDQTFQVLVDDKEVSSGSLLENFEPPVNPPAEIDDSEDKKPADWVDDAKIPDPDAKKPDDWDEDAPYSIPDEDAVKPEDWLEDEPEFVPDPEAEKPEEWDDEEDGDWIPPTVKNPKCEAAAGCGSWTRYVVPCGPFGMFAHFCLDFSPTKPNPNYKGKWYASLVDNPAYKGVWAPRKIRNPGFFEDKAPAQSLHKIGGVGIELWTMTEDILFSNIYVGHSAADAKVLAQETFHVKSKVEKAAEAKKNKAFEEDGDVPEPTLTGAPVAFIRKAILEFVELAKIDPVLAVKSKPETAGAVAIAILTLFGMLGALFGLVGAAPKPVTKVCFSLGLCRRIADFLIFHSQPRRPTLPLLTRSPPPKTRPQSPLPVLPPPRRLGHPPLQLPRRRRRRSASEQMLSPTLFVRQVCFCGS